MTDASNHIDMNEVGPLVSIVIPSYNHGSYVQETIRSAIGQDYKNIELIIIDDGSIDDSISKIREMIPSCEARFTRFEFRHRGNKGLCATLNEALQWCRGEYFAPIASDDILKSHKTGRQAEYLQQNLTCAGVFGAVDILTSDSINTKKFNSIFGRNKKYHFNEVFLHKHNLPAASQFLRTESVRSVCGYREDLIIEDWSMWLFLTGTGLSLDYLNETFASYRRHDNNISSDLLRMNKDRLKIVALFRDQELYIRAIASIYLISSLEWQEFDTMKALSSLKKSVITDWSIVFNRNFVRFFLRLFKFTIFENDTN